MDRDERVEEVAVASQMKRPHFQLIDR